MNTLTPEQLDMIKRLQPFFKERMGEWQVGDDFAYGNRTGFIEAISRDTIKLSLLWNGLSSGSRIIYRRSWHELLRIPKPIGWQNPERGLWGMILGTKELSENWSCCLLKITTEHHQRTYSTDCPFTALLKALCEQEKV